MSKLIFAFLLSTIAACGCPNSDGIDHSSEWKKERDVVCSIWDGCDKEYLEDLPVYEASDEDIHDICGKDSALACFCEGTACSGVILIGKYDTLDNGCYDKFHSELCWRKRSPSILHEYVHAVMFASGIDTSNHGPDFKEVLSRANGKFNMIYN